MVISLYDTSAGCTALSTGHFHFIIDSLHQYIRHLLPHAESCSLDRQRPRWYCSTHIILFCLLSTICLCSCSLGQMALCGVRSYEKLTQFPPHTLSLSKTVATQPASCGQLPIGFRPTLCPAEAWEAALICVLEESYHPAPSSSQSQPPPAPLLHFSHARPPSTLGSSWLTPNVTCAHRPFRCAFVRS